MKVEFFLVGVVVFVVLFVIIVIISNNKTKERIPYITKDIKNKLNAYKKVKLNMDEIDMLVAMNHHYDKTTSLDGNIYRFVYITRGGSSKIKGSINGATWSSTTPGLTGAIQGSINGSSEQHDESVVVIRCKDNKVIEISPYNMSSISLPTTYATLIQLAKQLNINKDYTKI